MVTMTKMKKEDENECNSELRRCRGGRKGRKTPRTRDRERASANIRNDKQTNKTDRRANEEPYINPSLW